MHIHTKTGTHMFLVVLLVVAPYLKQPKYPSGNEWLNKLWYIMTTGYCSTIQSNTLLIHATNWMALWRIMLSAKKEANRLHLYDLIYITFLTWQRYKSEEQASGCLKIKRRRGQEESGCATWGIVLMVLVVTLCYALLQAVIGIHWVKYTWDFFGVFLTTLCESIVISK